MRSRRPGELRESLLGQHLSLCVAAHLARTQLVADPLEGAQAREGANLLILKDGRRFSSACIRRATPPPPSPDPMEMVCEVERLLRQPLVRAQCAARPRRQSRHAI